MLVKAAADRLLEAAQAIADLEEVAEVYSCAGDGEVDLGDVDIIAIVRATEHEQLAAAETSQLALGETFLHDTPHSGVLGQRPGEIAVRHPGPPMIKIHKINPRAA
ncbi:MAG: hypothetical protein ACRDRI_04220 [Pseudonocardiaceae bacterium]